MSPICLKCGQMMHYKHDAYVCDEPAPMFPSTYWACDIYACEGCGLEIATGFSKKGFTLEGLEHAEGALYDSAAKLTAEAHSFRYPS